MRTAASADVAMSLSAPLTRSQRPVGRLRFGVHHRDRARWCPLPARGSACTDVNDVMGCALIRGPLWRA